MSTTINPNKALWEKGDFTRIAESMRESGEALVTTLGITEGLEVLDLGCGDGTTALPAARLGANVLGVDIASNLVEAGNARAQSLGLTNCRFQEGDASDLNELEDDSFDLVISIFGAMFAPKPFDVAKEIVRVTPRRPDRHGELDPQRPDARRPDPEDQHHLLAATSGRVRKPDDLGC
jgi:ubiquinone/menaquinone biosynthesis C-methylase UbiE